MISINAELYQRLHQEAENFGDISHMIEEAITFYLEKKHTHIGVYKPIIKPDRAMVIYMDIIAYLKDQWMLDYPNINKIPIALLYKAIGQLFGLDKRTVNKYLSIIRPFIKFEKDASGKDTHQVILS